MTTNGTGPDQKALFKQAMASFPSGVTIVTTTAPDGRWWGFTATSFCSVSMDPALVLVCLADTAECHPVFAEAERWIVHIVHPDHADLAGRFATRGADKFTDGGFRADEHGLPLLDRACVALDCTPYARHEGGDHTILVGQVESTTVTEELPAIYFRQKFHALPGEQTRAPGE
ncbi:MAG: flavin reductase family protein [Pseudonocardia sp.]|nr:flavin reductase family protein [Pseudonocardia sp.]